MVKQEISVGEGGVSLGENIVRVKLVQLTCAHSAPVVPGGNIREEKWHSLIHLWLILADAGNKNTLRSNKFEFICKKRNRKNLI